MLDRIRIPLGNHLVHLLLLLAHETTNDALSLLEQLNKLSGILGHLVSLITDLLLDLDSLLHLNQGVWGTTVVEAVGGVLDVTFEGSLVVLADLLVELKEGLGGGDAFGEGGEGGVVDVSNGLGDSDGRHLRCGFGWLCLGCQ